MVNLTSAGIELRPGAGSESKARGANEAKAGDQEDSTPASATAPKETGAKEGKQRKNRGAGAAPKDSWRSSFAKDSSWRVHSGDAGAGGADKGSKTDSDSGADEGVQNEGLVRSPSGSELLESNTRFPFGTEFGFWLVRQLGARDEDLQAMGKCADVHEFWKFWNSINPGRLPLASSLSIFVSPDRPRVGKRAPGGKWLVTPSSGQGLVDVFERLVLALVGGVFSEDSEAAPVGVVLTVSSEDTAVVEVWNRSAAESAMTPMLVELQEVVGGDANVEYIPHAGCGSVAAAPKDNAKEIPSVAKGDLGSGAEAAPSPARKRATKAK